MNVDPLIALQGFLDSFRIEEQLLGQEYHPEYYELIGLNIGQFDGKALTFRALEFVPLSVWQYGFELEGAFTSNGMIINTSHLWIVLTIFTK